MALQQIHNERLIRLTRQDVLISLALVAFGLAAAPVVGLLVLLLTN
ncbi:hypothetical protein [Rhodopseudomonas sp. B29]|nr:hypothetical protein [Rhodopseudomonas sp. B29]